MSLTNPVVETTQLKRWPFQRRPVARPGTALVFQASNGTLIKPGSPVTASDVSLRGLRVMYTVDTRTHAATFTTQLPSKNIALLFDVSVSFGWTVSDPLKVVQENVTDAPATCQHRLIQRLRPVCRDIEELDEAAAEQKLKREINEDIALKDHGLLITDVYVEVRSDAGALEIKREQFTQQGHLALHQDRVMFFQAILNSGNAIANILAHDPSKASEAATFIDSQLAADRRSALDAMKILLDGEQIRPGEIDDTVIAVVDRFRTIVAQPGISASAAGAAPALTQAVPSQPTAIDAADARDDA